MYCEPGQNTSAVGARTLAAMNTPAQLDTLLGALAKMTDISLALATKLEQLEHCRNCPCCLDGILPFAADDPTDPTTTIRPDLARTRD